MAKYYPQKKKFVVGYVGTARCKGCGKIIALDPHHPFCCTQCEKEYWRSRKKILSRHPYLQ